MSNENDLGPRRNRNEVKVYCTDKSSKEGIQETDMIRRGNPNDERSSDRQTVGDSVLMVVL